MSSRTTALKSRWTLQTRNTVLDGNALGESLYTDVQIEYLDGDQIRTISEQDRTPAVRGT